jgi:hypothetical protein
MVVSSGAASADEASHTAAKHKRNVMIPPEKEKPAPEPARGKAEPSCRLQFSWQTRVETPIRRGRYKRTHSREAT